jgi:hypothetical protein
MRELALSLGGSARRTLIDHPRQFWFMPATILHG